MPDNATKERKKSVGARSIVRADSLLRISGTTSAGRAYSEGGRDQRLAPNTIIESTFEVGRRFRCTMRLDCGQVDPGAVIRAEPGEWRPRVPERFEEKLADWPAGRDAVHQLAALTIGARLAVADA